MSFNVKSLRLWCSGKHPRRSSYWTKWYFYGVELLAPRPAGFVYQSCCSSCQPKLERSVFPAIKPLAEWREERDLYVFKDICAKAKCQLLEFELDTPILFSDTGNRHATRTSVFGSVCQIDSYDILLLL